MPREYNKVKRTAHDFFQNISSGGYKTVTELPEIGEENTVYCIQNTISSTKPEGLKFIRYYEYNSDNEDDIYLKSYYQVYYVDTLEHLNALPLFFKYDNSWMFVGEKKKWYSYNSSSSSWSEQENTIAVSVDEDNLTYTDLEGNVVEFDDDNYFCYLLSDIVDLPNIVRLTNNNIYNVEYKENLDELPSVETMINKSKTIYGGYTTNDYYRWFTYNENREVDYSSDGDIVRIGWDSDTDGGLTEVNNLDDCTESDVYYIIKFKEASVENSYYFFANGKYHSVNKVVTELPSEGKENIIYELDTHIDAGYNWFGTTNWIMNSEDSKSGVYVCDTVSEAKEWISAHLMDFGYDFNIKSSTIVYIRNTDDIIHCRLSGSSGTIFPYFNTNIKGFTAPTLYKDGSEYTTESSTVYEGYERKSKGYFEDNTETGYIKIIVGDKTEIVDDVAVFYGLDGQKYENFYEDDASVYVKIYQAEAQIFGTNISSIIDFANYDRYISRYYGASYVSYYDMLQMPFEKIITSTDELPKTTEDYEIYNNGDCEVLKYIYLDSDGNIYKCKATVADTDGTYEIHFEEDFVYNSTLNHYSGNLEWYVLTTLTVFNEIKYDSTNTYLYIPAEDHTEKAYYVYANDKWNNAEDIGKNDPLIISTNVTQSSPSALGENIALEDLGYSTVANFRNDVFKYGIKVFAKNMNNYYNVYNIDFNYSSTEIYVNFDCTSDFPSYGNGSMRITHS